jgi:hypothetical protein
MNNIKIRALLERYYSALKVMRTASILLGEKVVKIVPLSPELTGEVHLGTDVYLDNTQDKIVLWVKNRFGKFRVGPHKPGFDPRATAEFITRMRVTLTSQIGSPHAGLRDVFWLMPAREELEGAEEVRRSFHSICEEIVQESQSVCAYLLSSDLWLISDQARYSGISKQGKTILLFDNGLNRWRLVGSGATKDFRVHLEFLQVVSATQAI